ncbi:PAAR domain-containing protein [Sorangium sp. So ce131]
MPPAARVGDKHLCPVTDGPKPHVGGPILPPGALTVTIGFMPAAREGDMAFCVGKPDKITLGEPTVRICGRSAARVGDMTEHGGKITVGCLSVNIGSSPQAAALTQAAQNGTPFCEECEKARMRGGT